MPAGADRDFTCGDNSALLIETLSAVVGGSPFDANSHQNDASAPLK